MDNNIEPRRKPNYTRRRILFAIVSIGLISSLTIMLTWHGGSTTAALMVEGVYIATALWLIVRFAPRVLRIPTSRQSNETNHLGMFSRTSTFTSRLAGTHN